MPQQPANVFEPHRWRGWTRPVRAVLLTALIVLATVAIHGGALGGVWKFDDPPLLHYALTHSVAQTLFDRESMRALTYANIAPWNALFFEIGLPWAGLAPAGHYAHLLAVVAATALATWVLVAPRWGRLPAVAAVALYLLATPTAAVALSLMTGHYAYGLLFTALALICFGHAVDRGQLRLAWAAALFYGLACLGKELYVPLVLPLALWPVAMPLRLRLRLVAPSVVVALAYTALRLWVLGGVGGYAWLDDAAARPLQMGLVALSEAAVASVPLVLGSSPGAGLAAALLAGAVAGAWIMARGHRGRGWLQPVFVTSVLAVLAAPVVPMFLQPFPYGRERLFLLIGWGLAIAVAWALRSWRRGWWLVLPALAAMAVAQRDVIRRLDRPDEPRPSQYAFLAHSGAGDVLVPHDGNAVGYLRSMAQAAAIVHGRPAATIVVDDEALLALGPQRGRAAWAWSPGCTCLQPLGDDWDRRVARFGAALQAAAGRQAAIRLDVADHGRRKVVSWRVDGPPGAAWLDVHEFGRVPLARPTGRMAFGLDATLQVPDGTAHVRFTLQAEDGAWIRSPLLGLPLQRSATVRWPSPPP